MADFLFLGNFLTFYGMHVNQDVNQFTYMNASISVVCYKSKTLSNGENPLMLQISKNGKRKYQSLGVSINPVYWCQINNIFDGNLDICNLYCYCQKYERDGTEDVTTDNRCSTSWMKYHNKQLCPVAAIWGHWKLSGYKPRIVF